MHRSLGWVSLLVIMSLTGCGWFGGGDEAETYATPEGYAGGIARSGPFVLDAVYMDDSTRGIEGVVRLTWWHVFSVSVQNLSEREIAVRPDQFSMVDIYGTVQQSLPLDDVLAHRSHLMGPLMSYQRRAIRRAMWSGEPIPPGAFAVGYAFFARSGNEAPPWKFTFDPDSARRKDELVAVFPALRDAHAARLRAREAEAQPVVEAVADTLAGADAEVGDVEPSEDAEAEVAEESTELDDAETAEGEGESPADGETAEGETAEGESESPVEGEGPVDAEAGADVDAETDDTVAETAPPETEPDAAPVAAEEPVESSEAVGDDQPETEDANANSDGAAAPAEE